VAQARGAACPFVPVRAGSGAEAGLIGRCRPEAAGPTALVGGEDAASLGCRVLRVADPEGCFGVTSRVPAARASQERPSRRWAQANLHRRCLWAKAKLHRRRRRAQAKLHRRCRWAQSSIHRRCRWASEKGRRCQQALHLLRGLLRLRAGCVQVPRSRQGGREGPAVSAGLTSLRRGAPPCHRPGCDRVLCSRRRVSGASGVSRPDSSYA